MPCIRNAQHYYIIPLRSQKKPGCKPGVYCATRFPHTFFTAAEAKSRVVEHAQIARLSAPLFGP